MQAEQCISNCLVHYNIILHAGPYSKMVSTCHKQPILPTHSYSIGATVVVSWKEQTAVQVDRICTDRKNILLV